MRQLHELLKIVKETYKLRKDVCGICFTAFICNHEGSFNIMSSISSEEMGRVLTYLKRHKPLSYYFKYLFSRDLNTLKYYWNKDNRQARLEWLDKHIKRTKRLGIY